MFRTEIPLIPHPNQLPLSTRVLTIGSCFSDTIGRRLADYKVDTLTNPFGTVFNPLTACQLLRAAAGEEVDWQQHVVEARGRWQSYDLHATMGASSPVELLLQIQELVQRTGEFLRTANVVVLTLGTAWVYRLRETGELVSNCHKVPADKFTKELLTPDEIVNAVAETHAYLRRRNPGLRFVLTVSPVRHLKDTLPLNAVSKSTLRVACHYLSELLPDVSYFPAYELLLDDLRDYRFYAEDMLHPSKVAEDYIWERFTRTYFDAEFGRFKKEWHALQQALAHRPLYDAAPDYRLFLENTLARLQQLGEQVNVQPEISTLQARIEALPLPPAPEPEPEPEDDEERIDIGDYAAPGEEAEEAVTVEALLADAFVAEDNTEEDREDEEPTSETAEETPPAAPPKKKRRSRGGAKRTARKRAALAAQEAAAAEATAILAAEPAEVAESVTEVAAHAPTPPTSEDDAVVPPVETPEPTSSPAAEPKATEDEQPTEAEVTTSSTPAKLRRGRSAGQILADKKRRSGRRGALAAASAPMQEEEDGTSTTENSPSPTLPIAPEPVASPEPVLALLPAVTPEPAPEATPAVAPAPPQTEEAPHTEQASVAEPALPPADSTAAPVAAPAAAAASPKPRKPRAPRKPKAAATLPAAPAPEEVEPAAAPATAPARKPRPSRKKPAAPASASPTPETPATEPAPTPEPAAAAEKPPKKRRPPRKKPAASNDETPPAA